MESKKRRDIERDMAQEPSTEYSARGAVLNVLEVAANSGVPSPRSTVSRAGKIEQSHAQGGWHAAASDPVGDRWLDKMERRAPR
jgi:hypothetical protein